MKKPNKRYTVEFKKLVIETMRKEKLSYIETGWRFESNRHRCIQDWKRSYLEEGAEGFVLGTSWPRKQRTAFQATAKGSGRDLLAEVQRL